jgi:CBS domain containing-hemolysin-like protein
VGKGDNGSPKDKRSYWIIIITIITFILALIISFASDAASNYSGIVVAVIILIVLIAISIIFDGIAVAVTACEIGPLTSMASRKIKGSKIALKLISNAHKVANICSDVIGDICGIVSGACVIVIAIKIMSFNPSVNKTVLTILFSSTVAAITVGGKALMKIIAIKSSKEIVLLVAKFLNIFIKENKL